MIKLQELTPDGTIVKFHSTIHLPACEVHLYTRDGNDGDSYYKVTTLPTKGEWIGRGEVAAILGMLK